MSDGWHDIEEQRDGNGNPTAVAKAIQAIIDNGCDCEEEERDGECTRGCFPALSEAAIREQFDEIARLSAELAQAKHDCLVTVNTTAELAKTRESLRVTEAQRCAANQERDNLKSHLDAARQANAAMENHLSGHRALAAAKEEGRREALAEVERYANELAAGARADRSHGCMVMAEHFANWAHLPATQPQEEPAKVETGLPKRGEMLEWAQEMTDDYKVFAEWRRASSVMSEANITLENGVKVDVALEGKACNGGWRRVQPAASESLHNIASDPRIREYLHKVSERMCGFAISQPHRERREPATIPTTKNDQHSTHLHPSPDTEDFTKKGEE